MKADVCFANGTDPKGGGRAIAFFVLLQRYGEADVCCTNGTQKRREEEKRLLSFSFDVTQ